MNKLLLTLPFITFCIVFTTNLSYAQTAIERSVLVSAKVQTQPPRIDFSWPQDEAAEGYQVFKKPLASMDWGTPIAQLEGDASSFSDTDIQVGEAFEYAFYKKTFDLVRDTICVPPNTELTFTISDMYGIGLCCSFGFGYYMVEGCDSIYAEGSDFNWEAQHSFTICNDTASCVPLYITIKPDIFPNSTSWTLENSASNEELASSGTVGTFLHDRSEYGFIYAGVQAPAIENRGTILLLIQEELADSLVNELALLELDYIRDGWQVLSRLVESSMPPEEVRAMIQEIYAIHPELTALYIIGHVAVPYSGNIYPDTHTEHRGAWAADTYYGELNGTWTDTVANVTTAQFDYNHNVPGDGRWDQDSIPTLMELQVGRVDFYDMPALGQSEVTLLRRYLQKAHRYKNARIPTQARALIDDNFNAQFGAPAASGWRNFAPMYGVDSIFELDYFTTLHNAPYQWSYGCGSGSHISASGIGTTHDFAADSLQTIFTMLFGSQFGDWDNHNNFLRAAIATGTTLTNCWAGNPPYTFHQMALGWHIGYCIQRTQNSTNGVYLEGPQLVHTALMGDPGLRLHVIEPVDSLWATATGQTVELSWSSSADSTVIGYYLYRADSLYGAFERIHTPLLTDTFFVDTNPIEGDNVYMVKAIRLEESGSGTYYNTSLGTLDSTYFEFMVGNEEWFANPELYLFPNPANELVHIYTNTVMEYIEFFDSNGRKVLIEELNSNKKEVDVSAWNSGLYFVKIYLPSTTIQAKFIVH